MKKKTIVQGYTIIERKQAGEVMVVVGHSPTEPDPYVTWKAYAHDGLSSFNSGNYFKTKQAAMVDFYQRLAEAWEHRTQPPKERKSEPSR